MPQGTLIHFSSSLKDEEVTKQQQKKKNCVTAILRGGSGSAPFPPFCPLDILSHHKLQLEVLHQKPSAGNFIQN